MRTVVYFHGGTVADFAVPDEVYAAFADRVIDPASGPGEDLEKARKVLERMMHRAAEGQEIVSMSHGEAVAAAYIWHYFNTTDEETRIDGDILIVDADGDGAEITYMPLADVDLVTDE